MATAYKLFPFADILYACDANWWTTYNPDFTGERWSNDSNHLDHIEYSLNIIRGSHTKGFSFNPEVIHFGSNSGFQALNLAILTEPKRIVLVGFDMRVVDGKRHFHGDYPEPLSNESNYRDFIPEFNAAAKRLPDSIEILNATPNSALNCFPKVDLNEVLSHTHKIESGIDAYSA